MTSERNAKLGMVADQAVSSIGNLALTVLVAASTDVGSFARFALIYAAYSFLLGAQRAGISEPLILRIAGKGGGANDARMSIAVCVIAEALIGAGFALVGWYFRSPEVLCAAVAVPVALFQDALRFCDIAEEKFRLILLSDSVWLVIIALGALLRAHLPESSASTWLLLWGFGATVAAGILLRNHLPIFRGCVSWLRGEISLSGAFLGDHLLGSGLAQATMFLLPLVSSLSVVAAVKVGQTTGASVLTVLQLAVSISTLPALTRAFTLGGYRPAMRVALRSVIFTSVVGVLWAVVLLFIPAQVGTTFFGRSWAQGGTLAPIFALQATAAGFWLQAMYLMRVSGNGGRSVVLRAIWSPVIIGLSVVPAKWTGGSGAAWGSCVATTLVAAAWWWNLHSISQKSIHVGRSGNLAATLFTGSGRHRAGGRPPDRRSPVSQVSAQPSSSEPIYRTNAALVSGSLAPVALVLAVALPWLVEIRDPVETIELLIILVACTVGLAMSFVDGCRPLTLIFSTFYMCWLGIGPLYQLSHGAMAWGDDALSHSVPADRGALLLTDIFLIVFFFSAAGGSRCQRPKIRESRVIVPSAWPALMLATVLLPYVVSASGGFQQLFAPRATHDAALAANGLTLQQSGGATLALAGTLPGAAAVAAGLLFVCRIRLSAANSRSTRDVAGLVLSLVMIVLYCNPLSNTRFVAVSAFGALAVAWLRPSRRFGGAVMAVMAVVGAAFIYPLLSVFKSATGSSSASFSSGLTAFSSADFDGFQQIANAMAYVRTYGFGMGRYTFSALFYFVPRSVWAGKAQPAAIDVAANRDYTFTNLSLPVHAELYLDFGLPGLVLLGIGLGVLWGRYDERWVRGEASPLQFTLISYFACAQLGFIRGPLGSISPIYLTTVVFILGSFGFAFVKQRLMVAVAVNRLTADRHPRLQAHVLR